MFSIGIENNRDDTFKIDHVTITYTSGELNLDIELNSELACRPIHMFRGTVDQEIIPSKSESYAIGSQKMGQFYFHYSTDKITIRVTGPDEQFKQELTLKNPQPETLGSFVSIIKQWR